MNHSAQSNKKTLVLGASTNPSRYSYVATKRLLDAGHTVIPFAHKQGTIHGLDIIMDRTRQWEDLHTITLYVNASIQKEYEDWILLQAPKRVIFNPGTENPALARLLQSKGIEVSIACTLVLLSTNQY